MLPHSLIVECLDLLGTAGSVKNLVSVSMENGRTLLSAGSGVLGEVEIKRGIFQGDPLLPLLFVLSLIPLSHILRRTRRSFEIYGEKIKYLLFIDELYAKNERELESSVNAVRVLSCDIGVDLP